MTILYFSVLGLFFLLCLLLGFVILIQESKSTGLGASFGGESGESVFGASTADVLKTFTGYLVLMFFVSCLLLSFWTSAMGRSSASAGLSQQELMSD